MKDLIVQAKKILQDKAFVVCVILATLLSFGYGITHVSVGIDDLCFDRYVTGTWMLSANRWGTWFFYNFFKIYSFSPFWLELLTVTMYFITSIILCSAVKNISKDKFGRLAYILLACGYISFPILSFQFVYQSTNITVAFSNLIMSLIAYLIFTNFKYKNNKLWLILYAILGAFSVACYESCLQTYAVCSIIYVLLWVLYSEEKPKFIKEILPIGLIYILVFLVSIGLYLGIGKIITINLEKTGELHENPAYNVTVFEDDESYKTFIQGRYKEMYQTNTNDKFVYIFTFSSIAFIICIIIEAIRNKRYNIIWLAIMAIGTNFVFALIFVNLLYRIYYSWAIMIGFEYLFIYQTVSNIAFLRKLKIDRIVMIIFTLIILFQTKETNRYIYDDWRANEEAKNRFIFIGNTIKSYCEIPGKKVVYKYEGLTMTSTFDWSVNVFDDMGAVITQYINYNGFYLQNSGLRWEETLWMAPGDYENRKVINSYVAEGEFFIYVEINQE